LTLRLLATAAVLGLTLACSSPPPPVSAPASKSRDVATEAIAAADRGEWARAAELLREALRQAPSSVKLHYYLAVAASHLDLRDEAIPEFQWILANVAPELPEAQEARRWLTEAGVLARSEPEKASSSSEDQTTEETPRDSGLTGQVLGADGQSTARVQLFLKGAPKTLLEGQQWVRRTDDSGRFEFKRIPAGTYMLTDRVAGEPMWRLRVKLAPGETTTVELSEANSAKIRDDFPGS
jgi:tetratricopeptide (TPR) repeat protein